MAAKVKTIAVRDLAVLLMALSPPLPAQIPLVKLDDAHYKLVDQMDALVQVSEEVKEGR